MGGKGDGGLLLPSMAILFSMETNESIVLMTFFKIVITILTRALGIDVILEANPPTFILGANDLSAAQNLE